MDFESRLGSIERQFLCCYKLGIADWEQIPSEISWDNQKLFLDRTCDHKLNKKYPISIDYQQNFLKKLIQHLEQAGTEVHDDIYYAFCDLQTQNRQDESFFYKHYSLPKYDTDISLKESKRFVANGTTGLCSWQASIALSDWLLHHGDVVQGKSVIELGSGTGLCGFIVSKCCKADKVILTDGSPAVIDALSTNREINFHSGDKADEKLSIVYLPWEECELIQTEKFDVILAADVVYDSTEFDSLIGAIDHLFRLRDNKVSLVMAATVRNEITLNEFLSLLESKEFVVKDEDVIPLEESQLFWDRSTPVKIMVITRSTGN